MSVVAETTLMPPCLQQSFLRQVFGSEPIACQNGTERNQSLTFARQLHVEHAWRSW
jgi:hypothetical protein